MIIILICVIILIFIFILFNIFNYDFFTNNSENKYACLYAYYEKNEQYKDNLKYFLENAIIDDIDYYIIINGECSIKIPEKQNIQIIYRENVGFDFGAWNYCINNNLKKKYDYYVFLNTSVKGPYLNDPNTNWLQEYLKLFNNKDVKLVGSSINIYYNNESFFGPTKLLNIFKYNGPYSHIQSMFFILDSEGFDYLNDLGFFKEDFDDFKDLIAYKEIGMSQLILKKNWNINCILSKYRDHDYRKVKNNFNPTGCDPYWNGAYFGKSIDPYEVIFYKNNR